MSGLRLRMIGVRRRAYTDVMAALQRWRVEQEHLRGKVAQGGMQALPA